MNKIVITFLALFFVMQGFFAFAQTSEKIESSGNSAGVVTVATVNIYNAQIINQENDKLKIYFELSNRERIQPDVRYAIRLVDKETKNIVDEFVYQEVVNLNENQFIAKEIEYEIPQYLNGEFGVWLVAKNKNGMILSVVNPGKVKLEGNNNFLEIDSTDCFLGVGGESDKKYKLNQGVDVKGEEELILNCSIKNNFNESKKIGAQLKTYWRSTFGDEVDENEEIQFELTLDSGVEQPISLILPKAIQSQSYDAVLELVDDQGVVISNKVIIHYVLRGPSATIQNFTLDKNYYQKGDIANVSFFWSLSADSFPNSRLGSVDQIETFLKIEIRKELDNSCIGDTKKKLEKSSSIIDFELPIISDCKDPIIIVTLENSEGEALDRKEYLLTSDVLEVENNWKIYVSILALLILVIIFIIFLFKKNRNKKDISNSAVINLLIFGGIFLLGNGVEADTFNMSNESDIIFAVNLNKSIYETGESITATGSTGSYSACGNLAAVSLNVGLRGSKSSYYGNIFTVNLTGNSGSGSYGGSVSSIPGNYNALFVGTFEGTEDQYTIPYSVVEYECTGTRPINTTIHYQDNLYLTGDLPWEYSSSSTSRKCQFSCNSNYVWNGSSCVDYDCTGFIPSGGNACSGDSTGLTSDLPWTIVGPTSASCTLGMKCEYYMPVYCTGVINDPNANLCLSDSTGLIADTAKTLVNSCSLPTGSDPKCEYNCNSTYTLSGGICVPTNCSGSIPPGSIECSGDGTSVPSSLPWIEVGTTSSSCTSGRKCEYYSPVYYCTGVINDPNANLCLSDSTGLIADTAKTLVNSCSLPTGSDPKCEYACNSGYTLNGGACMPNINSPLLTLNAITPINLGENTIVTYTIDDADFCTASTSSSGAGDWSGSKFFNDGTYNYSVTPTTTGTKIYRLSCSNAGGTIIETISVNVNEVINNPPVAAIIDPDDNQTINVGDTVFFTGTGSDSDGTIDAYEWLSGNCSGITLMNENSGDNGFDPNESSFNYTFNTAGTYNIYLSTQDDDGVWSTNCPSRTITVNNPPPTISISAAPNSINLGQETTVIYTVNNADSCTASTSSSGAGDWFGFKIFNDGTYNYPVTPTATGTKIYRLSCSNTGGTTIETTNSVVVSEVPNDIPTAIIDQPGTDQAIGTGNTINFIGHGDDTDTDGSIEGYEWLMGDCNTGTSLTIEDVGDAGFNPLQSVLNYTFNTVGTYTVYFKVKDNKNAWSSCKSRIITVTDYSCTDIPNSTICPSDGTGLVGPVSSTVVADGDCSPPEGSDPKCEYTCNSPHVKVGNTCIIPTCIPGDDITNAELCSGDSPVSGSEFRDVVLSCSDPAGSDPKCEYTCNDGYRYDSDSDTCELIPTTRPVNWQEINP